MMVFRKLFEAKQFELLLTNCDKLIEENDYLTEKNSLREAYLYKIRLLIYVYKNLNKATECVKKANFQFRDDSEFIFLEGRIELLLGQYTNAFGLFRKASKFGKDVISCNYEMFKILILKGKYRFAEKIGERLLETATRFKQFHLLMAEVYAVLNMPTKCLKQIEEYEKRIGKAIGNKQVKVLKRIALASLIHTERPLSNTFKGLRHIAIGGVSYTGSTILGILLGSLSNTKNIGESHWIPNLKNNSNEYAVNCRVCGENCSLLSKDFRATLSKDTSSWYFKIAKKYKAKTLVSSDKNYTNYWMLDPKHNYGLIILYKSRHNQLRSEHKFNLILDKSVENPEKTGMQYLDIWERNYNGLLNILQPQQGKLVLNWEAFILNPYAHLKKICDFFDLESKKDLLDNLNIDHFIGGNRFIGLDKIRTNNSLKMRPSNAPLLPAEYLSVLKQHNSSFAIEKILNNAYRRDFGLVELPSGLNL